MTPWWVTLLIALASAGSGAGISTFLSERYARTNAGWSNRDNLVLKERAEIYVGLVAQGAQYLADVPVAAALLTDAELEGKLRTYASANIQRH